MISRPEIEEFVKITLNEIIPERKIISLDTYFISAESEIESIEIVQIITRIEELLDKKEQMSYDLFEKVLEYEELTFTLLIDIIYADIASEDI